MFHKPVLLNEVLSALNPSRGGIYFDCTFGAGGHSRAIFDTTLNNINEQANNNKLILHAFDRDKSVEQYTNKIHDLDSNKLDSKKSFYFHHARFTEIPDIVKLLKLNSINGALLDLGVSSMQIDQAERGFSFMKNGLLNMDMGRNNNGLNAKIIVNQYPEIELANIIYKYGNEKYSRKIAKAICEARKNKINLGDTNGIETTEELSNIILNAVGGYNRYKDTIHPATRTFQALRIVVNDELHEIEMLVNYLIDLLDVNGLLCVISFHSLEDVIVKNAFKNKYKKIKINKYKHKILDKSSDIDNGNKYSDNDIDNNSDKNNNIDANVKIQLSKTYFMEKIIQPASLEVKNNIRARSAKLRILRRCS